MIAADLRLGDPSRIDWIVARVFADRKSTMPEIEAVLLALNVLGDANGAAAPRARVVAAYRDFIKLRPPMAGFVGRLGLLGRCARIRRDPQIERAMDPASMARTSTAT